MHRLYLIASLLIIFVSVSCKKIQPPYDPCQYYVPFNGSLDLRQEVGDTTFSADTIFPNSYLYFVPGGQGLDSCVWQINNSPAVTSKAEIVKYMLVDPGQHLDISLTAYRRQSSIICAKDTLVFRFSKSVYVVDRNQSLIIGDFKGVSTENITDTFTIHIQYTGSPLPYYFLSNLPKGCIRSEYRTGYPADIGYTIDAGYKSLHIDGGTCLPNIHGNGSLISRDSLAINYYLVSDTGLKTFYTFRGKRS